MEAKVIDGKITIFLTGVPKYYVEYNHPSGDYFKSPEMTIEEMEKEFNYSPITEELFVNLMKENFKSRRTVRESNIQIIKKIDDVETILYEQKKF